MEQRETWQEMLDRSRSDWYQDVADSMAFHDARVIPVASSAAKPQDDTSRFVRRRDELAQWLDRWQG